MKFTGLAHICIFTDDIEKSKRFYVDNLGFKVTYETEIMREDGVMKYALVRLGNLPIELLQKPDGTRSEDSGKGKIDHFAIEVEEIEAVVALLRERGVVFTTEVFTRESLLGGIKGAFFTGPNGENIELFEYTGTFRP